MAWSRQQVRELLVRAQDFWNGGMWRHERPAGLPLFLGGIVVVLGRSLYIVIDAFRRDRIRLRAAALTYVTLLSLVPLLAVAFSLFTAFGGLEDVGMRVKDMVVDALAVQQREVVNEYLDKFITGANAGGLGAVGSTFLFVTAASTLSNIETAFNDIWGVSEARGWLRRFQVYLPLVTFGPVLFGVAFSSIVAVEGSDTVKTLVSAAPGLKALFGLGPWLVYALLFFALYMFLPNTKVRVGPALVGGLVAGGSWVLGQRLFTAYAGRAISYSTIYGSFGAVPLTILWIYISWTLVLLGATITFALQSARTYEPDRRVWPREREQVATRLVLTISERYRRGLAPITAQALIDEARMPPRVSRRLLEELVERGMVLRVVLEADEVGYAPARPLDQSSLVDVVQALRGPSRAGYMLAPREGAPARGVELLEEAEQLELSRLAEVKVEDLVRPGSESSGTEPGPADGASRELGRPVSPAS